MLPTGGQWSFVLRHGVREPRTLGPMRRATGDDYGPGPVNLGFRLATNLKLLVDLDFSFSHH